MLTGWIELHLCDLGSKYFQHNKYYVHDKGKNCPESYLTNINLIVSIFQEEF